MMRAGFRFLSFMLLLTLGAAVPQVAVASDAQTIRKALAKDPFRDLPGVKLQQAQDDEPPAACTSSFKRPYWGPVRRGYQNGLTQRVYRCDVDNVTVESTKQPDEIDWKKQKRYYKPWIDDGFDRDR
jgi:hypothetical protein